MSTAVVEAFSNHRGLFAQSQLHGCRPVMTEGLSMVLAGSALENRREPRTARLPAESVC